MLTFILALAPKVYRWKVGGNEIRMDGAPPSLSAPNAPMPTVHVTSKPGRRQHLGLIAQDVKAALDEADVDCGLLVLEDKGDTESLQSLRYDQLIAPLIQAVKELTA